MSFKNYVTRKLSIQKSRLSQILPTTPLLDTKRLSHVFRHHILDRIDQLPPKVDLRFDMTSVKDQLNIGSSVAHCLAGAYECLTKKSNDYHTHVSRLFIDYNARMKRNKTVDSGYSIIDGIEALEQFGTCLEVLCPYDISHVNIRPSDQAYEQAESHQINKALKLNFDLHEMKSSLAEGFPFVFALKLYPSFDKAAETGVIIIPRICEQDQQLPGSHAMLAVGYSDRSNAFIVRNSWGEEWGDEGYCYIPYDYMTNPELCFDLWTIRKVANNDFGREYWHFDDLVNYSNVASDIEPIAEKNEDEEYDQTNWRDTYYRRRKSVIDESWEQYRYYQGYRPSRTDDDYFNERYRRDRYDRDNEPYDRHTGGHLNSSFYSQRHFSYPYYDPYQDVHNRYNDDDDDYRRSMF